MAKARRQQFRLRRPNGVEVTVLGVGRRDELVKRGYVLLDQSDGGDSSQVEVSGEFDLDVANASVADVLAWVGQDPERAAWALQKEQLGKNRSTLVNALETGEQ